MEEIKIVELKDENGKSENFECIMTFELDDRLYVAITPEKDLDGIKNGEVMLLEIREDEDGTDCYLPLESEEELERVFEEFEKLYYE